MACQVIVHSWTLSGLVGAFLDLAIAYLLLCCSAVSYFISKFLSILGLSLPCPCNGLFGYPYRGPCFQKLLVDWPTQTVSSVQLSVKSKFPFDALLARNDHCQLNLKLIRERKSEDGGLELDGEVTCSSFSDPRRSHHSLSGTGTGTGTDSISKFDLKSKGGANHRQRHGLRRRRRASLDYGRLISESSYDHMDVRVARRSPSVPSKIGSELHTQDYLPLNFHDDSVVPGRSVPDFEEDDATDKSRLLHDNTTSFENPKNYVGSVHGFDSQDENAVRILEQALEEEQAARAALWSELEQERTSAATAADEAMAMISRLQEEKASIEIESRQYQRILEEKSAYDAEEMNILKEIIVRREREKHFLEKEVEAYRKVLQENVGLESQVDDTQGQNETSFLDSSDDAMLMLEQLSKSIDKRGNVQLMGNYPDCAPVSLEKQTSTASSGKEASISESYGNTKVVKGLASFEYSNLIKDDALHGNETNQEIQEKGMLSMDATPYAQSYKPNYSPDHHSGKESTIIVGEKGLNDDVYPQRVMIPGVVKSDGGKEMHMHVSEPHVHDVHIVDSKCDLSNKSTGKRIERLEDSADGSLTGEPDINRSFSDVIDRFPSLSSSPSRSFIHELRRHSLSAVDHERLKIDNEIGWLRERLRAVQDEKEKLKNSLERRERGETELKLLEDIATQLREIRHLTEPEKAARQASLPPLSSKGSSRKRRSRSIPVGGGQSASS